jgi:hypothetical protein
MTYKFLLAHLKTDFLAKYDKYTKFCPAAHRFITYTAERAFEQKRNRTFLDFTNAFKMHFKLQQFILKNKIDPDSKYSVAVMI